MPILPFPSSIFNAISQNSHKKICGWKQSQSLDVWVSVFDRQSWFSWCFVFKWKITAFRKTDTVKYYVLFSRFPGCFQHSEQGLWLCCLQTGWHIWPYRRCIPELSVWHWHQGLFVWDETGALHPDCHDCCCGYETDSLPGDNII